MNDSTLRTGDVASLLRVSRRAAGLSQASLAERASTTQPAVSLYETGRQVPELETLERLAGAAGFELELRLVPARSRRVRVLAMRKAIRKRAEDHGLSGVRLFGSVARCQDEPGSDVDLIVDPRPESSLFDLAEFAADVEELLGDDVRVDVTSSRSLDRDVPEAILL